MKEIKAKENMYLTQKVLTDESLRMFVKALLGDTINEEDWRDATEEEKSNWEAQHKDEPID